MKTNHPQNLISRAEFVAGNATFSAYYSQFVTPGIVETVKRIVGVERLTASRDPAFNDIPLAIWDACFTRNSGRGLYADMPPEVQHLAVKAGETAPGYRPSAAFGVCLAKEAAKQIVTRNPTT